MCGWGLVGVSRLRRRFCFLIPMRAARKAQDAVGVREAVAPSLVGSGMLSAKQAKEWTAPTATEWVLIGQLPKKPKRSPKTSTASGENARNGSTNSAELVMVVDRVRYWFVCWVEGVLWFGWEL